MKESKRIKKNRGMTYVELIVVLSIFAVMSSIVLFNYGEFQAKVDIKNLASDIALKIVEAQKSALSGNFPAKFTLDKKPSFGVYFNLIGNDADGIAFNKKFIYFADLDNGSKYDSPSEKLDTIYITKNNFIEKLEVIYGTNCSTNPNTLGVVFKRPDSGAKITSNGSLCASLSYAQITIKSPRSATATIKIYPSGRVQVN